MASKSTLSRIRESVDSYIGEKVTLKSNTGRKRIKITEGVIEKTYPSIFIVSVDPDEHGNPARKLSYTYSDILTKTIQLYTNDEISILETN